MSDSNINQLYSDVAYLRQQQDGLQSSFDAINRQVTGVLNTQINTPPAPVANLLYNGELGHSVNSWFDSAPSGDDKEKECAYWFSNGDTPEGVLLDETDARTSSTNKTLKTIDHSTYDPHYSHWNNGNGWAELSGIATLDAILPSNFIDATTPLARVSFICAKANAYIEIPTDARMFAGIYDNTSGQEVFLTGSLGFTAERVGSVAASTVERRYKIQVLSDRGFTLVSPEVIVTDAPADGFFTATQNVSFSWKPTAGQLKVNIYEYVPSLTRYRLLAEISSSFSYIDEGTFIDVPVTGYPTSPDTVRKAIYYTKTGELSALATNATSPRWDTINFPIGVPDNYDKTFTTGRQWLRIGLTVAANYYISPCTSDGTDTITSPASLFYPHHAALYAEGATVEIYDSGGTLLLTTTTVARVDYFHLQLAHTVTAATGLQIRIVGAGWHGIYIDKVHLGYQQNTSYAPNSADNREQQPVAAPDSSSQGGTGAGGSGGGIVTCIVGRTPVKQADGKWKAIESCQSGEQWASGEFRPNLLIKIKQGFDKVRSVRTVNGCYLECTDTERFFTSYNDTEGTSLFRLRVNDVVLTEMDGRIEQTKIVEIGSYLPETFVYTPTLSNSRLFIAGEIKLNFWQKILILFRKKKGGFVLHNRKDDQQFDFNSF